jgi:copper(I)-binding protein
MLAATALAGCGSNDSSSASSTDATTDETTTTTEVAKPKVVSIVVVNGAPKGGIVRQTVSKGDRVVLVVKSDVADEIHLHGYDKSTDVAASGTARLPFTATIPGRFEVELESRGVQIADMTVNP